MRQTKNDPYRLVLRRLSEAEIAAREAARIRCWSCSRDAHPGRAGQQYRGFSGFVGKPICEYCRSESFSQMHNQFTDEDTAHLQRKNRRAHDYMKEWQRWCVYLHMMNEDLKREIRIRSKL